MSDKINDARREYLKAALNAGLWTLAGSSGLIAPLVHAFGNVPKQLANGKSIYELRGNVLVDDKPATESTIITANSNVVTESNSHIIFVVGKDAHILRSNSRMDLGGSGMAADFLRLVHGKLLSVFGKRFGSRDLKVRTSVATIGVRGTGLYTESTPESSYICTCYGETEIMSSQDESSKEVIVSKHHDSPRYVLADGKGGELIQPAPFIDHTDAELMLIEALVGRTAPFSSVMGYDKPRRGY